MKKSLHLVCLFLCTSCAFAPQAVKLSAKSDAPSSQIGNGHSINLNVVDERPKQTLGTRGVKGMGAELTLADNLTSVVQKVIGEGLVNQNFKPLNGENPEFRELRVEIRNLDYNLIQGFWSGTLRVDTSLKAICIRGSQRPYEQLHRGEVVDSVQAVQTEEANNEYISQAISSAVSSLIKDKQLLSCLSN